MSQQQNIFVYSTTKWPLRKYQICSCTGERKTERFTKEIKTETRWPAVLDWAPSEFTAVLLQTCSSLAVRGCRRALWECLLSCCQSLLSLRWSYQGLEVMPAWHVVIDWTGPGLFAAVTKAHSGPDNGALTGRAAFIALPLSLWLPPVYCVRRRSPKAHVHHRAACLSL